MLIWKCYQNKSAFNSAFIQSVFNRNVIEGIFRRIAYQGPIWELFFIIVFYFSKQKNIENTFGNKNHFSIFWS